MAETPILSYRRPFHCPVKVSGIFERWFSALSEFSIRGGRKPLLEPSLGKAFTTWGRNSLFPARGLKPKRVNVQSITCVMPQFTFPRKGIETLLSFKTEAGDLLWCRNSLFPARGLKRVSPITFTGHLVSHRLGRSSLFPARGLKPKLYLIPHLIDYGRSRNSLFPARGLKHWWHRFSSWFCW